MPIYDLIYFIAFCIFLVGSSLNLRGIKFRFSLWIMVIAVLIDFFATVIPNTGFKSLSINIGVSFPIITGTILGVIVWILFLAAVFVRLMGKMPLFYVIITVIKVVWFVELISFLYGVYNL